ncbi:MAG: ATP-binding protein [Actinomycetota bacterium]
MVLGAGAAYCAFRVALALTTDETGQVQIWGGATGVALFAILLVVRRGRPAAATTAKPGRGERRAAAKAEQAAAKEAQAEAKAAKIEAKTAKQSKKSAEQSERPTRTAAPTVAPDATVGEVALPRPVDAPADIPVVSAPAVATDSRPAVFADLTSPDTVGSEQVAGLAQRALAAVSEQLAALDGRPLDATLVAELRRLATRVRRNGDALVVLAGAAPAPVRRGPMDLAVAVDEALESLDGADRVRVRPLDPAMIDAPVAAAIADIVAELTENALQASQAPEPVEVFGRSERGGYALAVVDRGPGLPPETRSRINDRLAGRAAAAGGLGFEVISRLAATYDLRVELAPARGGGCAALVGVPAHRVLDTRPVVRPTPAPIPVPAGVDVAADAPEALPSTRIEGPPTELPERPDRPVVAPVAPAAAMPSAPNGHPAEEVTAAMAGGQAPRPNLGLGSFADLHAVAPPSMPSMPSMPRPDSGASSSGPVPAASASVLAADPAADPAPARSTPAPFDLLGSGPGDSVASLDPSQWVIPDVSADLLPGRAGKRGRALTAASGSRVPGSGVSWGEGANGAAEDEAGAETGEERSDYFDAFRAAADRAREHAGFDEN